MGCLLNFFFSISGGTQHPVAEIRTQERGHLNQHVENYLHSMYRTVMWAGSKYLKY